MKMRNNKEKVLKESLEIGKMKSKYDTVTFDFLYNLQLGFQKEVCNKAKYKQEISVDKLPLDNVELFQFHCLALLEEIGELVKSDKRWKNFRNKNYDKANKTEEIADCFIVLMNICIYSGITSDEMVSTLVDKMLDNFDRLYSL